MSTNNTSVTLYACSRCFSRHPFEELSSGQQLCKECRGSYPMTKCTYCRSEFQQSMKGNTATICKKCEQNVKSFGKPTACQYCNIIAAFIGTKCQRCTNSEKRYGPPVTCEQCKQKCAFDRHDEDKKVDGKLLCWLCTLSYKRALARTKQTESDRKAHLKIIQQRTAKTKDQKLKTHNKKPQRVDVTKIPPASEASDSNGPSPVKMARLAVLHDPHDINISDHVVAVTSLKEKIASLQRQISQKDGQLLAKEKQITELKAKNFTAETELRNKMKDSEKQYENKISSMQSRITGLLKEVATLSKSTKRERLSLNKSDKSDKSDKSETGTNSESGTDSPVP